VSLIRFGSIDRIARVHTTRFCVRLGIAALAAVALLWLAPDTANATKIERLTTPGGIEVWLVRDPTLVERIAITAKAKELKR
jgi:hypothetical protein